VWRSQLQKLVRAWLATCMAPRWHVGCATGISTGRRCRATSPVWPRNRRPGGGGTGTTSSPGFVSGNPEAASQLMVHCSGTVAAMFAATLVGLITAANAKPKNAMLWKVAPAAYRDFKQHSRGNPQFSHDQVPPKKSAYASQGLAEACKFVYNDAKFVNERAQNDILLLSRGITRLNERACQDAAVLGLGFLKLDARARKDTQKIDHTVKERAARLNHFARAFKERAQSDLKKAADKHWSDGALEADLRRADLVVKRRAMEDAFMALKVARTTSVSSSETL